MTTESAGRDARYHGGGDRTTALYSEIMEGTWGRRPTGDSVENDVAHGQAQGPRSIPGVAGRRHVAMIVETCEDHTA